MRIVRIDAQSPHLVSVKRLWRANSATLGYLPEGAFTDHAERGQILVALDSQERCIGYLMYYRTSSMEIRIVHLCIGAPYRRKGVAKALADFLKRETRECKGIRLRCRRDYEANKIWPQLGFVATSERLGRTGEHLTEWWFDHGHPTLFSFADEQKTQSKLAVAVDACVFYDLQDEANPDNEESKALLSDWLQGDVELCVTNEVFNEIERNDDPEERKRRRGYAQGFTRLHSQSDEAQTIAGQMRTFFPEPKTPSDRSDVRQLAHAIAADAQFFVTYDSNLLSMVDEIYDAFGMSIVRPSDLIIHLDELLREVEYRPARLAGSGMQIGLVQSEHASELVDRFQCSSEGETKGSFRQRLSRLLAHPREFETCTIQNSEQESLALLSYGRQDNQCLEISIFRTLRGSLSSTLARHLVFRSLSVAAKEKRVFTEVTDPHIVDDIVRALQHSGFVRIGDHWAKVNLPVVGTVSELAARLAPLSAEFPKKKGYLDDLHKALAGISAKAETQSLLDMESSLWPAKIVDESIPTFIVSIKPHWAAELFDESLARQMLWGAEPELMLNSENVYYRAKHPGGLRAPARILWYVSTDAKFGGSKHLRAYSRLDEVAIGKPKDLFRRFRRLGVFKWKHVFELANGDLDREIMALRFSATELFSNPVHWNDLQTILESVEGRRSQLQSPLLISSRCFVQLYGRGMQIASGGDGDV